MLIVNADDWGGFREGTDAIEACFEAGAISSATGMVHMPDSRRAAELARANHRPIGLHLNLTEPFGAGDVPAPVRERQRLLRVHFADLRRRRWRVSPDPRVHRLIADALRDQFDEFHALYGREPSHVDSHHHVHVCPDVFLSRALVRGTRVRQTISPAPGLPQRLPARLAHRTKHAALAARFSTTDRFWRVSELAPGHHAVPIAVAVEQSTIRSVEVTAHPSFPGELPVLRSDRWLETLAAATLRSFAALPLTPVDAAASTYGAAASCALISAV